MYQLTIWPVDSKSIRCTGIFVALLQKGIGYKSRHHLVFHSTHRYRLVFWIKAASSLPTSALNNSTSCQQSSGLLSFVRKHLTTSSLALFTAGGISSTFFRPSSFFLNSMISVLTEL